MPDTTWSFLIPGDGPHTFRWTGSNAFLDNVIVKMSKHRSPNYFYEFKGIELVLERKLNTSSLDVNTAKWQLRCDGRLVEEHACNVSGVRDMRKNVKEGSYQIATHFTPSQKPKAVFVFTVDGKGCTAAVGHDQTGRVELTYNNRLISGRSYKILDNGLKLQFDAEGWGGVVAIYPHLFSFRYKCCVNGVDVPNVVTAKASASTDTPPEINPRGGKPPEKAVGGRRKSSVGWSTQDPDDSLTSNEGSSEGQAAEGGSPFGGRLPPEESKMISNDNDNDNDESFTEEETKGETRGEAKEENMAGSRRTAYDDYEPTLPRGVTRNTKDDSYSAGIMIRGKFLSLGVFDTVEEAARAYQAGKAKFARK